MKNSYTKQNKIQIYNNHYTLFCNNLNPSLKTLIGLENDSRNHFFTDWQPPATYGLENSERIIPEHYFDSTLGFNEINMFDELIKDIRNMKPLNDIQLNHVKKLPK